MKRPGMSLAEVLISIGILGLVITVGAAALTSVSRVIGAEAAASYVTLGAGRIFGPLDDLLRQGVRVQSQYPATGVPQVVTGENALVFTVPSLQANGAISATTFDTIVVTRNTAIAGNPRLIMTVHPDETLPSTRRAATEVIATNVEGVYFRYNASSYVNATSLTATIRLARSERNQIKRQLFILHAALNNHP